MTSFTFHKGDASRRRSAPQEIFQTFRSQFSNTKIESPTNSSNYMQRDTVKRANLDSQANFFTLPHKRSLVGPVTYHDKRRSIQRHSWMPTRNFECEFLPTEDDQANKFLSHLDIKNTNRVPYYCNELFCKNEMGKHLSDEKEWEDEDDQISSKPLCVNNG